MFYSFVRIISTVAFISIFFAGISNAQMRKDIQNEIEKIIYYDTDIIEKEIPGYSIALLYQDSVFIYHYGYRSYDQKEEIDDQTIFEIGGLSKIFTSSLIEILVQEKLLQYDQPFNHYLDSLQRNKSLDFLTISDLVSHYSGFPKLPYEFGAKEKEPNNPYAFYTKKDLMKFYKEYIPLEEKRKYAYSGLNYALLEIAIEKVTGQKFEEVLEQKLLSKVAMQDTYIHANNTKDKLPVPGFSTGKNQMPEMKFQSFAASEGIKTTIKDLIHFLQVNIGNP